MYRTLLPLLGLAFLLPVAATAGDPVVLLVQGSDHGELKACHCPGDTVSGPAKRAGLLRRLRNRPGDELVLGAGDHVPPPDSTGSGLADSLLSVLGRLSFDAVVPGELEVIRGKRFLEAHAAVPWVAANLEGSEAVAPVRTFTVNGVRVAVTGIVDPLLVYEHPEGFALAGITLVDPYEALGSVGGALADADRRVLLFHGDLPTLLDLAPALTGIDWVLVGHGPETPTEPGVVAGARVLEAGDGATTFLEVVDAADRPAVRVFELKQLAETAPDVERSLAPFRERE